MPRFITVAALAGTVTFAGLPRIPFSLPKQTPVGSLLIALLTRRMCATPLVFAVAAGCLPGNGATIAPPAIVRVVVQPATVMVPPGESQAFTAYGAAADGRYEFAPIVWSATGGTITPAGYFTADSVQGTFAVTATSPGWGLSGAANVRIAPRRVAAVAVRPGTATLPIDGTWLLDATLHDSVGIPLDRRIRWASDNPGVAIVDESGLVTAIAPGTAHVAATAEGVSGSGVVNVVLPGTGPWPNEPRGFRVIADNAFSALTGDGWQLLDNARSLVTLTADPSAPLSPPSVLQYRYPIGFTGGAGPGAAHYRLGGLRQLYVGLWWKPSDPWQGHVSNSNKIQYVRTDDHGTMFMAMYGLPSGPYELFVFPQFSTSSDVWLVPNVNRIPVELGKWHRIEWLMAYNTTIDPPNGIVRWWLDGQLIGDYYNVNFPSEPLTEYKMSAVWGGAEPMAKTEVDYYWYDHVRISGK